MASPKLKRSGKTQDLAVAQQQHYDDAMEEQKEQKLHRRARRKFANTWDWFWHSVRKIRAFQWAGGFYGAFILIWAGCVTYVLLDFSLSYIFDYIDIDREWYMVNAAAALAQSQAARAILAAHHTRDALCVAVSTGIVQSSTSYAQLERVLAPALNAGSFLSSVEMSFSDSSDLLVVGSRPAADGSSLLTMQSSAADCYLLGVEGCIDLPGGPGQRPEWFGRYDTLPAHRATGYGTSGVDSDMGRNLQVKSGWEDAPILRPTRHATDGKAVAWSPSYRLGFRCGNSLEVAGRVTLELGGLSGGGASGWLNDPRLGEQGEFYLVDRYGNVLASHTPSDLLIVQGGRLRFARIWELRDRGWAQELRSSFGAGGTVAETRTLHGGVEQVVLQQLPVPLDHFAIVVVAPDNWHFANVPLYVMTAVSIGLASVPWTIGLAALSVIFVRSWRKNSELAALDPSKNPRSRTNSFGTDSLSDGSWNPMRFVRG